MELHDFERDELATLPWMADTMDVCDLDAGFSAFVQHASANADIPMRISANVTDDFGNVTGFEPVLELREEDCRFRCSLAGLKVPRWSS